MDIRHLTYFIEVAKHSSFTKAARTLHVSQPSLSKTIKQLEREFDVPLFYRSSKKLELTDAGEAVLKNAQNVIDAFQNLQAGVTDLADIKKGQIRIGLPPIIGAAFVSSLISSFIEDFPLIDLRLSEVGSIAIKKRHYRLTCWVHLQVPLQGEDFECKQILHDPLVAVMHHDHPLSLNEHIPLKALEEEHFVLYRNDFSLHRSIIEECLRQGFFPNAVCESSQKDFMLQMVEAKLGIALLPEHIAKTMQSHVLSYVPLEDNPLHLELVMIWRKDSYLPFAARTFIEEASSYYSTAQKEARGS
ncbi:LOW QUALITY PROTEIN: LysR family regulatory protein CidR [Geomicrobium sp. JCM 19055]|nr:LOW QUALITY PROTEIN: LysR family regulatory protein CidR [Geomicrobium sp. JCM 19055]